MYYKSVNRGVYFTKPGKYAVGLVIVLGLIATSSGYNGFYLSLGLGLGLLIVSGVLSEKIMKACEVEKFLPLVAEAHQPFTLSYQVKNASRSFTLYGVEVIYPAARKRKVKEVKATLLTLPVQEEITVSASYPGLARGCYAQLSVRVQTVYPFGWLEKFKFADIQGEAIILPPHHPPTAEKIREQLQRYRASGDEEREFFTHRPFEGQGIRDIDWRKSAGRDSAFWVRKVYRGESTKVTVVIRAHTAGPSHFPTAAAYESWLSRIRTVADTLHQMGFELVLDLNGVYIAGWQPTLRTLAALEPLGGAPVKVASNVTAGALAQLEQNALTVEVAPLNESPRLHSLQRAA